MLYDWIVLFLILCIIAAFFLTLRPFFTGPHYNQWSKVQLNVLQVYITENFKYYANYWHNYEIHNAYRIQSSKCLIVGYHSRPTFDNIFVLCYLQPNFIASHFLFAIPIISTLMKWWGAYPSKSIINPEADKEFLNVLLHGNKPLYVVPGGAHEAYKNYEHRYQLQWKSDPGFVRILVHYSNSKDFNNNEKIQIIPLFTKDCEDLYYNIPHWYTLSGIRARHYLHKIRHGNLLCLFPLLIYAGLGLGFILFPKPIKLDTYIGQPIYLQKNEHEKLLTTKIQNSFQTLIDNSMSNNNILKTKRRKVKKTNIFRKALSNIYAVLYGIYIIFQNLWICIFALTSIIIGMPFVVMLAIFQYLVSFKRR